MRNAAMITTRTTAMTPPMIPPMAAGLKPLSEAVAVCTGDIFGTVLAISLGTTPLASRFTAVAGAGVMTIVLLMTDVVASPFASVVVTTDVTVAVDGAVE